MPPRYAAVLEALGKKGDFKDGVLKVNIPRTDLKVTIGKRPAPTPFGFGGWLALTTGSDDVEVMMGDLVLTEDEVNPVMSALLDNGLDVTALHNHFFHETPRIFFMHVHGMGSAEDLAQACETGGGSHRPRGSRAGCRRRPPRPPASPTIDGAALAKIIGHPGEQNGPVYKITIGRSRPRRARARRGRSTRGWDSTPGRRSPEPTPTRWSPATWRCSPPR